MNPAQPAAGKATPRPWQQINATVYQLVPNDEGELVHRFSFNVQSNNRMLGPGEDEQIASLIVRSVNQVAAVEALIELATEVANHLYEKQDMARCREMARAVLAAVDEIRKVADGE